MVVQKSRGMALLTIIIALILVALSAYLMVKFYTAGKQKETPYTSPIERASNLQCRAEIRRIETAIQMYRLEKGENPTDLSEAGLSEKDWFCPVTHSQYEYNKENGTVVCPDHGR